MMVAQFEEVVFVTLSFGEDVGGIVFSTDVEDFDLVVEYCFS